MRKDRMKKIGLALCVVVMFLIAGIVGYVRDYYHSEDEVQQYFENASSVKMEEIKEGILLDGPGEESAFVFYPGAKVEYTAYIPLMHAIAEQGVDIFIVHMPCNLAFLGKDKAGELMEEYEYNRWYLGGHSLGGAMAAVYASEHLNELDGLVLMAAYPTKDFQQKQMVEKIIEFVGKQ